MPIRRLLYCLHSGKLYGTERMALATCIGLRDSHDCRVFAPSGEALEEAERLGFTAESFTTKTDIFRLLWRQTPWLGEVSVVATGMVHSILAVVVALLRRSRLRHVHVVHGGTDDRLSYGRKWILNWLPGTVVAVSPFVREKLIEHGVFPGKIEVIENFLAPERIRELREVQRSPREATLRLGSISRLDPIKRMDVLFDAVATVDHPEWYRLDVYGAGSQEATFRERAPRLRVETVVHGFTAGIPRALSQMDLLVHTCPEEPFGLVILEAMAAGVLVIVPDTGGAAVLVEDGVTGWRFPANDPAALAALLQSVATIHRTEPERWNRMVAAAGRRLEQQYSPASQMPHYRRLL